MLLLLLPWQEEYGLIRTLQVTMYWLLLMISRTVWLLLLIRMMVLFAVLVVVADAFVGMRSLRVSSILRLIYR